MSSLRLWVPYQWLGNALRAAAGLGLTLSSELQLYSLNNSNARIGGCYWWVQHAVKHSKHICELLNHAAQGAATNAGALHPTSPIAHGSSYCCSLGSEINLYLLNLRSLTTCIRVGLLKWWGKTTAQNRVLASPFPGVLLWSHRQKNASPSNLWSLAQMGVLGRPLCPAHKRLWGGQSTWSALLQAARGWHCSGWCSRLSPLRYRHCSWRGWVGCGWRCALQQRCCLPTTRLSFSPSGPPLR